MAYQHS